MPGKLIVDEIEDSGGTSVIGRKNYIINGNFDIWQRGTSLTGQTAAKYLADRWEFVPSDATYDYEQGTFTVGQTDVPNNPNYFANITVTSADDNARLEQKIEDVYTLAGETITISFWAKYTTNAPTGFSVRVRQYFGSGGSTQTNTALASGQTLTTSWQKFTVTGTVPSISGKTVGSGSLLGINVFWNDNNEIFDVQIAQVQVEKGSVATDFEVRPIGEELSLCQRYYIRTTSETGYYGYSTMLCINSTNYRGVFPFVNTMREAPTIAYSGSFQFAKSGVARAPGSSFITTNGLQIDVGGSGFTAGDVDLLRSNNDSSAYLEADAEL